MTHLCFFFDHSISSGHIPPFVTLPLHMCIVATPTVDSCKTPDSPLLLQILQTTVHHCQVKLSFYKNGLATHLNRGYTCVQQSEHNINII